MIRFLIVAVVAVGLSACPVQIGDRCGEGLPPCSSGFSCVEGTCSLEAGDAGQAVLDAGVDAGFDAGVAAGVDAGVDGGFDAGADGGFDAGADGGFDAGADAGFDAGVDAGFDAGVDGGFDAGVDAGFDAGPPMHLGSVIESWTIPANATQVSQIGFDLSGDGGVDNQLSAFLIALPFAEDFRNGMATSTDTGELIVWKTLSIGQEGRPPFASIAARTPCRLPATVSLTLSVASTSTAARPSPSRRCQSRTLGCLGFEAGPICKGRGTCSFL